MPIIKLSVSERRRLSVFITCLLLAVVAWVFATLSEKYVYTTRQAIVFKNAPQKRAFRPLQTDTVEISLQGTGWQMLFSKMDHGSRPIPVDLHTLDHNDYIALNTQLERINRNKDLNHRIIAFNPDTLYFDFTNRLTKKVPVLPLQAITYKKQYMVTGKVTVQPAYVVVNGPGNVIENVNHWLTDSIKFTDVRQTINTIVRLQPVKSGNLNVYPKMVQVRIPVEEFTEKTLDIPVKVSNNTHYDAVRIFPQKVRVTFTVPLSRYTEIDENFFEANADLSLWHQGYSVLPVKITHMPAYCKIVSTVPQNVDFIIKK
ncbi:YbbR-like domain-containing protein [Mucilaginibacter sp. Bleaf8]|uniref:YbbR-like domain-containing protein n=1 Tax=Mucilaginibacter sp. Bleaf8 TaxID=2834430 RepID=UPI001BD170FA|nr:YbbR-like domain-containing protein [Mucilaginibacter sp. Bleaf8]MBS7563615.1 YbbR-like domain-containing protein [Mucilaginibacter sp. Bleaf8]